jgi:hypothetical protein
VPSLAPSKPMPQKRRRFLYAMVSARWASRVSHGRASRQTTVGALPPCWLGWLSQLIDWLGWFSVHVCNG